MIRGKEGCSWLIASISFIKYAAWCSVESEENARVRKRRPAEQGHVEGLLERRMGPWRLQKAYEFRCGKCTAQGLAINGRDCSCSLSVLRECIQGLTNLQETKSWVGAVMGLKANHIWEVEGRCLQKKIVFLVVRTMLSSIWLLKFGKKNTTSAK